MYDINLGGMQTSDGDTLHTVILPHAPNDADKIARIAESMAENGWQGRPVILHDCGDYHRALTGTHRLCAAIGIDIEIHAVILPDDLTEDEWETIDQAGDDDQLLNALEHIAEHNPEVEKAAGILRLEIEENLAA